MSFAINRKLQHSKLQNCKLMQQKQIAKKLCYWYSDAVI